MGIINAALNTYLLIGIFIVITMSSSFGYANSLPKTYSVEDKFLSDIPDEVEQSLLQFLRTTSSLSSSCAYKGMPISIDGIPVRSGYFVTVTSPCQGNAGSTIWILDTERKSPVVLMQGFASTMEFGAETHNGLKDIKLQSGNAGSHALEYWSFNGRSYIRDQQRSWTFDPRCTDNIKNPENPFLCNEE